MMKREQIYLDSMLYCLEESKIAIDGYTHSVDNADSLDIIKEASLMSKGKDISQADNEGLKVSLLQNICHNEFKDDYVVAPEKLKLSKDAFPKKKDGIDIPHISFSNVEKELVEELKYIRSSNARRFAESLLNLLFRYTVNLPASKSTPDISLYDHIKTTASIAVSLYDYHEKGGSQTPFLLIGGDMSGIQPYIYEIVSKYAGKNLKGRSFYLRLLSDAIVRRLLCDLDLFNANVIYDSGGCFYLLAPNTEDIKRQLSLSIKSIEDQLFKVHGTKIFVAIDYVELDKETILAQNGKSLQDAWGNLFLKRDKKKQTRFSTMMKDKYDVLFCPSQVGGTKQRDVITGQELGVNEKPFRNDKLKDLSCVSQLTGKQVLLGQLLRDCDVMLVANQEIESLSGSENFSPIDLGVYYYFLKEKDLDACKELQDDDTDIDMITFNGKDYNSCDFLDKVRTCRVVKRLQFYGGNHYNNNTFEEMCKNDNFHRLGVLRMDVDNLGTIFQGGIAPEWATLSRYSELSRSFDYFFSGYINAIQQQDEFREKSFIVYSGGDDLFVVGDWSTMINFAQAIRIDFSEFTCNNDAFSISGGVAIVPDKFPIMKGAEESAVEEGNAKNHHCKGLTKNSISFMDYPMNWNEEFVKIRDLKDLIVGFINDKKIEKSFISKVMMHWTSAKFKNHKMTNVRTLWLMTYDMSRFASRVKDHEAKQFVDRCKLDCCSRTNTSVNGASINTDYHPLEIWAFASRWAELELRTDKE